MDNSWVLYLLNHSGNSWFLFRSRVFLVLLHTTQPSSLTCSQLGLFASPGPFPADAASSPHVRLQCRFAEDPFFVLLEKNLSPPGDLHRFFLHENCHLDFLSLSYSLPLLAQGLGGGLVQKELGKRITGKLFRPSPAPCPADLTF